VREREREGGDDSNMDGGRGAGDQDIRKREEEEKRRKCIIFWTKKRVNDGIRRNGVL
jgi:hypothetical protein